MNHAQQSLLNRILTSRHFANATALQRTLTYICNKTSNGDSPPHIKEYEIAVNVLGRRENFDPKSDPIVRVNVATIRERLDRFFANEGKTERLRLAIPRGQYRARFFEAGSEYGVQKESGRSFSHVGRFWQPYLGRRREVSLLFSKLLFLSDGRGNFIRNVFLNELDSVHSGMKDRLPGLELDRFEPTFHFLSSGEMQCMYELTRFFGQRGIRVTSVDVTDGMPDSATKSPIVLIGSRRTNPLVHQFHAKCNFFLTDSKIMNSRPEGDEKEIYEGYYHPDKKLLRRIEYALITRGRLENGSRTTLISGNHGRAVEGAGRFLIDEGRMSHCLGRIAPGTNQLPDGFQLLLEIEMVDLDEEVVRVDYVTHRIPGN